MIIVKKVFPGCKRMQKKCKRRRGNISISLGIPNLPPFAKGDFLNAARIY